jgi:hypothetical protein
MDEVSIYNMALDAVGARSKVSLPTEKSREAEECRLWFGPARDQVLRAARWPSAKAWYRLPLLKERNGDNSWVSDDPEPGYAYAYGVPSDMLAPRFLAGYEAFTLSTYPGNKMAIMTNVADALICYTKSQTNISLWDTGLRMAIVYGLAAHIAMPLQGKASRARNAIEQANSLIMSAREDAANTDTERLETIPSWISARGYGIAPTSTRYFYPLGDLFSAGALGV